MTTAPLPVMDGLTAQFCGHLAAGTLHLQRCTGCGSFRHLPRYLCPGCHDHAWSWAACSGQGTLYAWTTTMRPLHPAFATVPMVIATVATAEGPRLLGRLIGAEPDALQVGLPITIEPDPIAEGVAVPRFRLL